MVHSPVQRSAPSVRRERLSRTQCRNGCEIKKKCELVAAKRIENLIYTRAVLRCNAPGQQQLHHSAPASNSSTIAPRPATASRWRSARAPRPAASCQQHLSCHGALASIFSMALRYGAPASNSSATAPRQQQLRYGSTPATTPLRRPCQQQTSSGGEKYSGLASNLAHLGRIC